MQPIIVCHKQFSGNCIWKNGVFFFCIVCASAISAPVVFIDAALELFTLVMAGFVEPSERRLCQYFLADNFFMPRKLLSLLSGLIATVSRKHNCFFSRKTGR